MQILVDGSDANSAGQALNYAAGMTMDYSTSVIARAFQFKGRSLLAPIQFEPRIWYNPDLRSSEFLIPGLIGFIIVLTRSCSTSMTVVREKERGTMEQIMVSPLRPIQVILGKTIPYVGITLVASTLILILGYYLFWHSDTGKHSSPVLRIADCHAGWARAGTSDLDRHRFPAGGFHDFGVQFASSLLAAVRIRLSGREHADCAAGAFKPCSQQVLPRRCPRGDAEGGRVLAVWQQFLYMSIVCAVMLGVSTIRMRKRSSVMKRSLHVILEIIRKEFYQIRQDKRMLVVSVMAPVLQVLLLGYAATTDIKNTTMVVCDQDHTAGEQGDYSGLHQFRILHRAVRVETPGAVDQYIEQAKATIGLVVPNGFGRDLLARRPTELQVILDGADANTANVLLGYATQIVATRSEEILAQYASLVRGRPGRTHCSRSTRLVQSRPEEHELHGPGGRGPRSHDHHDDPHIARHREGEGNRYDGAVDGHSDQSVRAHPGQTHPVHDHRICRHD